MKNRDVVEIVKGESLRVKGCQYYDKLIRSKKITFGLTINSSFIIFHFLCDQ